MRSVTRVLKCAGLGLLLLVSVARGSAEAQVSLTGAWLRQGYESPAPGGPSMGDFSALPIKADVLLSGDSWDEATLTLPERQCSPYPSHSAFHGPAQIRIWEETDPTTRDVIAIKTFIAVFAQERTIWMDGRPHPGRYAPHTWQGFSTGRWDGNRLTVTTTHIKPSYHRRIGILSSDQVVLTEQFIRHGNTYLTYISVVDDPVYLTESLVYSALFLLNVNVEPSAYQTHTTCQPDEEIAGRPRGYVPHYLLGTSPFAGEYATQEQMPLEATRGGAATMYPEYKVKLKQLLQAPASTPPAGR